MTIASRGRKPRHIKGAIHSPWREARLGHFSAQCRVSAGRQPAAQDHQNRGCAIFLLEVLFEGLLIRNLLTDPHTSDAGPAMFFVLSKTLGFFLVQSNLIIASGALGLGLIFSKRRRMGRWLLACCVAALLICGFSPLGALMLLPLETRFSPCCAGYAGNGWRAHRRRR